MRKRERERERERDIKRERKREKTEGREKTRIEWIERKSKKLEKQEVASSTSLRSALHPHYMHPYREISSPVYVPRGLKCLSKNFIVDYSDEFIASRCC